jgi:hypothetical protein
MATVTDSDLKELKEMIVDLKLTQVKMSERLEAISLTQVRMDERIEGIGNTLTELKKQTDKQDNRLWVLISGMFLALLGFAIKTSINP